MDGDCDGFNLGGTNFSRGTNGPLDENALDESAGVCGGVAREWNRNGVIVTSLVAVDLNQDVVRSILRDHDDWPAMTLRGALGGAFFVAQQTITSVFEVTQ